MMLLLKHQFFNILKLLTMVELFKNVMISIECQNNNPNNLVLISIYYDLGFYD